MKNNKSFRFKFSALIWVLLSALLVITLAGVGFNIYNLILVIKAHSTDVAVKAISLAVSALLPVFTLSIIFHSKYVLKNGYLYNYFGFVWNKTKISEIVQFTHFKNSDKLVAYFKDEKYTVIVIAPNKYNSIIKAVREINPQIIYEAQEEN